MSFWASLRTAWRVADEYPDAVAAARSTIESGGSVTAAVRAFAAETSDEFDDEAARHLEAGLVVGIEYAQRAASALATVAARIESDVPPMLATAAANADRIAATAANAGAVCVAIATRLEALKR